MQRLWEEHLSRTYLLQNKQGSVSNRRKRICLMGLLESGDKRFPSVSLPAECQDSEWKALLAHEQMLQCLSEWIRRIFRDHPRLLQGFVSRSSCALPLLQAASFPSNIHSAVIRDESRERRACLTEHRQPALLQTGRAGAASTPCRQTTGLRLPTSVLPFAILD